MKVVAPASPARGNDVEDDAAVAVPPALEDGPPGGFDETAEAAFLGEARQRGETVAPRASTEPVEETTTKPLPPLDQLVDQIPADVRDVLEELFRARFVSVKRFPKKALKS